MDAANGVRACSGAARIVDTSGKSASHRRNERRVKKSRLARAVDRGAATSEVRVGGETGRQRAERRLRRGRAGAVGLSDRAAQNLVHRDALNVITGQVDVEVEDRERPVRPNGHVSDLRQARHVRDREKRVLRTVGDIHLEVRQKQSGGRRDTDVARVVVIRRRRPAGDAGRSEREGRIRSRRQPLHRERGSRHQEGGHHGQNQEFFHAVLLHIK